MYRLEELLISTIATMLDGLGHVAVGASSPVPGAAALLARARSQGRLRVSLLGSRRHGRRNCRQLRRRLYPAR